VLIRTDGAGSSHRFLEWLTIQRLSYSVGFALPSTTGELLALMDEQVWTPAYNSDGAVREGAWVAELTGMLTLTRWPAGMRVIARKERPHPGAQLRITDADGLRVTAFATNSVRCHASSGMASIAARTRLSCRAVTENRTSNLTAACSTVLV